MRTIFKKSAFFVEGGDSRALREAASVQPFYVPLKGGKPRKLYAGRGAKIIEESLTASRCTGYNDFMADEKSIAAEEDILESEWVNDLRDAICWENGLKWLSKAIVSDKDSGSKEDLKRQLEEHIRFALRSTAAGIREIGFFYCLAWKKMNYLEEYDGDDEAQALLFAALKKLYASHAFKRLSFKLFICPEWQDSLACVTALLSKRLAPPVAALLERLLADPCKLSRTLVAIEELLTVLGIAFEDLQGVFAGFWKKRALLIEEAFENDDYVLAHDRLAVFSKLGKNFSSTAEGYGLLLERHLERVPLYLLPAALSWMLTWNCQNCLDKAVKRIHETDGDFFAQILMVHYAHRELGLEETRRLIAFTFKAGEQASLGARELLCLCMERGGSAPLLGQAIREGLEDEARREETFSIFALLVEKMELRSSDIIAPRSEFLSNLWSSVAESDDPIRWHAVLETFERIVSAAADPFLESEFFLPLLRTCLLSPSIELTRLALNFVGDRARLLPVLKDWLAEPALQEELTADLKDEDMRLQIAALNRLLTMYGRIPVSSKYISECLQGFLHTLADSPADDELKRRMMRTSGRILQSVGAQK